MGVVAGAITARQYEVGRELADEWLEVNPTDLGILQLKARTCVEGGLWDCALEAFAEEYELDSSLVGDTVFYQQVVGAAQASSDTAAMLYWTGEAVTQAPSVIPLWRAHASALSFAGMTDSVVTIYDHLLSLDPTDYRSALAGSRIMLENLVIDTVTPLDTIALAKGMEFLNRATTATRDTNVLMNVALTQFRTGQALVTARKQFPTAVELLESAVANDVRQQFAEQSHFFLAYALMFRIYEFDPQVTETESCDLVEEEAQMIARGKEAIEIGSSISPAAAEQFLQSFNNFEGRIPTLRRAYECPTP
jgi:tetratricopeptide (TPR) repeat protein